MGKPKRDITPDESAQVESLAAHGHTQEEIAYFLKIPYRTFQRKLKEDSLLMASWRRGRFKGKEYVLSRLMRFIKNDELNAINLSAIQFYLRNTGFGMESNNNNNENKNGKHNDNKDSNNNTNYQKNMNNNKKRNNTTDKKKKTRTTKI